MNTSNPEPLTSNFQHPTVICHSLVKNEENFLWFAASSVIAHVDKLIIWDTGSTDRTPQIIEALKKAYPEKVVSREVGPVKREDITHFRSEMLQTYPADWLLLLDGDEVWWEDAVRLLRQAIDEEGQNLESIVAPYVNAIGDIYHFQNTSAGKYEIDGKRGFLTVRAIRLNEPVEVKGLYPKEGFFKEGVPVQERNAKFRKHLATSFLHLTHLKRSSLPEKTVIGRVKKFKLELGEDVPLDFYYPEVFFRSRPDFIPSPWQKMNSQKYWLAAGITPLRKLKRRIFK